MRWNVLKETIWLMLREEWRLHTTLFRGGRFVGFPAIIFLLALGGASGLLLFGLSEGVVRGGVLLLAALIGFQTGSAGFEGQDAVRNLLGEVTLVLYSSRTLPISKGHTMAAFFVKEIVYYTALFLLPLVSGFFVSATLIGTTLSVSVVLETMLLSISSFITGVTIAFLISEGAILTTRLTGKQEPQSGIFGRFVQRLGSDSRSAIAAKSLLDVQRSSGGVGKLLFSSSALLVASYVTVSLASQWVGTTPSFSILFGTVLSATSFPTYAWLTRIDDVEDYRLYPITATDLRDGKALAFIALEVPIIVIYYLILSALTRPTALDVLLGIWVVASTTVFVFGLTVALTEFKPSEYLFDGSRFIIYSGGLTVAYLPLLISGLFYPVDGGVITQFVALYSLFLLMVGAVSYAVTRPSDQLKPV